MQNQNVVKERTSRLGKMYDLQRGNEPLNKIVSEIYGKFEFWISCGEVLPIQATLETQQNFTATQLEYIINELNQRGCVVDYLIEKSINGKRYFVLTDLL